MALATVDDPDEVPSFMGSRKDDPVVDDDDPGPIPFDVDVDPGNVVVPVVDTIVDFVVTGGAMVDGQTLLTALHSQAPL